MSRAGFSLVEVLIVVVILGILAIIMVPNLLESKRMAQSTAAIAELRNIASAQAAYSTKASNKFVYGTLQQMASQSFLDSRFASATPNFAGYTFSSSASSMAYTITASPDDAGNPVYYVNHSNAVHYASSNIPVGN